MHRKLALHYALFLDTDFEVWVREQIEILLREGKVELEPNMPSLTTDNYQKPLNLKYYTEKGVRFNSH